MKIIGFAQNRDSTSYDGGELIVQMTGNELAHIAGYDYASAMPSQALQIDAVFKVSDRFHRIQAIEGQVAQLERARQTLLAAATLCDTTKMAFLVPAIEEEEAG